MLNTIGERLEDYWTTKLGALAVGDTGGTQDSTTDFQNVTVVDLDRVDSLKGNSVGFIFADEEYQEDTCRMIVSAAYQVQFRIVCGPGEVPTKKLQRIKADLIRLFMTDRQSGVDQLSNRITPLSFAGDIGEDTDRLVSGVLIVEIEYSHDPADPALRR